jgi:hypothetical protein
VLRVCLLSCLILIDDDSVEVIIFSPLSSQSLPQSFPANAISDDSDSGSSAPVASSGKPAFGKTLFAWFCMVLSVIAYSAIGISGPVSFFFILMKR